MENATRQDFAFGMTIQARPVEPDDIRAALVEFQNRIGVSERKWRGTQIDGRWISVAQRNL